MKDHLNNLTTKEKIISVTMEIIAEEGFQNITIRKIASQAGVNVAAVNYHFGAKDAVINEALKTVTDQLKATFEALDASEEDPKVRLALFIQNYTDMMLKYPDILKNLINHTIHNKPFDNHIEYMLFLKTEGMVMLRRAIAQISPELDEYTINLKILHLLSALSFPVLIEKHIQLIMGFDIFNEEMSLIRTKVLVDNICN